MKTKALLSAIGLVLVLSGLSIGAQTTLKVPSGEYVLIAGCRLQTIETDPWLGPGPQFEIIQFDSLLDGFITFQTILGGWGPSQPTFGSGEGGIFQVSGGDVTLVFQQQRTEIRLPLPLQSGFSLVCCQSNLTASFEDIVGRSPANGTMLYQFNQGPGRNPLNLAAPDYTVFTFANGSWSPTTPVIGVTEAVFVFQPPQLSNVQITATGISFDVMPPVNMHLAIEYSDSLTQPSWQTLTNVVGTGASIKITDTSIQSAVRQRFYRARSIP